MTTQMKLAHLRHLIALAAALATAGLAGCVTTTPEYDKHFGESVRTVRAMQTLNPDAATENDPGSGIDGRAATAAMDRYNGSYRSPEPDTNAYTVGVGVVNGGSNSPGR